MFGVIRENHEKRVKKGGVPARVGAHGAVCINREQAVCINREQTVCINREQTP